MASDGAHGKEDGADDPQQAHRDVAAAGHLHRGDGSLPVGEQQDDQAEHHDRRCPAGLGKQRQPAERQPAVTEPVVRHRVEAGVLAERAEKNAPPSMIQPSGLPGLRQATTRPTTPNGATTQTGTDPPLASRFWCASPASGTAAITSASSAAPQASTAACADPARSPPRRPR